MRRSTRPSSVHTHIDPHERLQNELRFALGIGQLENSWVFLCVTLVFSLSAISACALQTVYPLPLLVVTGGIIARFIDAICLQHEDRWIAELDRQERVARLDRTGRRIFHLQELRASKQLVFELSSKKRYTLRIRRLHFSFAITDAKRPIDDREAQEILQWIIEGLREARVVNWNDINEIEFLANLPQRIVAQGKAQLH